MDLNAMSETGQMITSLLMIIGGAPSLRAGGMKVTATFCSNDISQRQSFKTSEWLFLRRRIDDDTTVKMRATGVSHMIFRYFFWWKEQSVNWKIFRIVTCLGEITIGGWYSRVDTGYHTELEL